MTTNKLTFMRVKEILRTVYSMTITRRPEGEFRVNFPLGMESTAHYTNCLEDALGTGIDMRKRFNEAEGGPIILPLGIV